MCALRCPQPVVRHARHEWGASDGATRTECAVRAGHAREHPAAQSAILGADVPAKLLAAPCRRRVEAHVDKDFLKFASPHDFGDDHDHFGDGGDDGEPDDSPNGFYYADNIE